MYIAALRIANDFGCDAIGIQYQQGLKDMAPASDLVEGLLNNVDRPPAFGTNGQELYAGRPLPHFNEVDECAGLDALVTNRVWTCNAPRSCNHSARCALGRALHGRRRRRFCLALPDLRRRAGLALHRRISRSHQRAPACHVFPARRRHAEGDLQARPHCLEPRVCRGWKYSRRYGARHRD